MNAISLHHLCGRLACISRCNNSSVVLHSMETVKHEFAAGSQPPLFRMVEDSVHLHRSCILFHSLARRQSPSDLRSSHACRSNPCASHIHLTRSHICALSPGEVAQTHGDLLTGGGVGDLRPEQTSAIITLQEPHTLVLEFLHAGCGEGSLVGTARYGIVF